MKSETKLSVTMACYVALICVGMVTIRGPVPQHRFLTGVSFGSIFGFTILAAVWSALGPGRVAIRLFWATLLIIVCPLVSLVIVRADFLLAILPNQLAIVIILVAILAMGKTRFGIRLQKLSDFGQEIGETVAWRQFGIRHLMIVTTLVALLLAFGRIAISLFKPAPFLPLLIFGFLAFGTCISCLPFLISVLSLKRTLIPTLILFVLAGMATVGEAFLYESLKMDGPDVYHFVWINFFALLPILIGALGVRFAGYRLVGRAVPRQARTDLVLDQPSEA